MNIINITLLHQHNLHYVNVICYFLLCQHYYVILHQIIYINVTMLCLYMSIPLGMLTDKHPK